MNYDFKELDSEIQKAIDWFSHEITSLRTGRATPALIDDLEVSSYGVKTPLKHIAAIGVEDARTLSIRPWDKSNIMDIESAIRASSLGLQPVTDQDIIRLVLPALTEERRVTLQKLLKDKLEHAKISVRQARDEVWSDVQEKEREGEIPEDDKFRLKDELQKKVDFAGVKLDEAANKKEKEISS